jgi:hypothetical protein
LHFVSIESDSSRPAYLSQEVLVVLLGALLLLLPSGQPVLLQLQLPAIGPGNKARLFPNQTTARLSIDKWIKNLQVF